MTTITIIGEGNKKEKLVAISHEMYQKFLVWQKHSSFKVFNPTLNDRKILSNAKSDYIKGNILSLNELKRKLGNKN